MASRTAPGAPGADVRPFDEGLSLRLDVIQIALDEESRPLWCRWHRLRKTIAERSVPAWYPEVTR